MRSHLWRRLVIVCFWIVGLLSPVALATMPVCKTKVRLLVML